MAESMNIEVHGSLGVVLWAAAKGLVRRPDAESHLKGLENSTLWLSPKVRIGARAALLQIFASD
jgi:predicted nucleic acid-binding protein